MTFADALAALVSRLGTPTSTTLSGRLGATATWGPDAAGQCIMLSEWLPRGRLRLGAFADRTALRWTLLLAGTPTADAPLAPLPDALDAAAAWLSERNDPTRGP